MHSFLLSLGGSLVIVLALWSCENCGPSAEPLLGLSLQSTTSARLDTVYSPDTRKPLPAQPYSTTGVTMSRQLVLPINLNADSTRYIFRLSGRQDTVTVFYRRDFLYKNRTCGYVLNLIDPKSRQALTTRGTVGYVYYADNRDGSFLGGRQDTGISLTIRL